MKKQTHRHQNTKARTLSQFRQRTKHYHQIVTTQESGDRVEQHLEWGNAYSFIFDSLASLPQSGCKQHLLKERKQINDYLAGIELQILRQFSRWKLKQLNKLDCLIDFFDKAKLHSIFKVPKRTRGQLQAEHIEVVRVLEGTSKREKKDLDQYFCTLADEFAQTLKKSYNKGNNTIELFKQMLASNQYDSTNFGDEGYQAKVKNKVTHLKTKLRTEFNKLKDIADILISEESQKDCRIATVHSCNIQNEQKEQQRQPKNVFQIDFDEKMSKSMQNPSLSKSCFVEEFGLKNEQFKSKMTINLSKSRQIQKKEIHTRINYGKRHYPIQINEDLETQRMRLIFLRNNLKRRKENIKAKQEIPHGLQMRGDEVLIIWNGKKRTQIMNFIFLNKKVKYLIINDKTMATRQQIKKILKFNQGIQGIDLNCDNYVQLNLFTPYKFKFFNCFKSFRFMREKDTVKYFPWKKQSIRSHSEDLLQNITNYQLQNFTVTVSQQLGKIPQKLKELSFCQLEGHLNLNLHLNSKMIIQRINCLQILSFSNVTFSSLSYNLVKNLFLNNRNIKKLAFSHCFLQFSKLITNFEHLNRGTLRQLLLEANECQPKEALNQENCQLIGSFHHLQVLIIVNFYFFNRKNEFEQISGFCEIGALINLNYLNLYNSQPIFSDFLQYLDPNTHHNMRTLNLGMTKIDSLAVEALSKFVGLQTLVLDFTSINGKDFIQITKDMQNLRKLSLQRAKQFYNSEEIGLNYLEANSQELVKCQDFERLSHKTLEYVNICGCRGLKEYQWSSFIRLKIIKFNNSQLGSEAKNRLNLLKIQLYQEQQGPSVGGANIKIPDGKKQGSEKQKETGKLQGVQQIFNNSSKKFAKPNSLVRFNQLVSRRKSHQAKKSKTSVYSRSCVICEHSQQRKPRERTPKLGKRITKVKTEVGRWEGNRAANLEINKIKFEQGQL